MLKIFDILRATGVKRWHIVETDREQRLCEHMYSVSVLAGEIASRMGHSPEEVQLVIVAALFHDIDEVVSGDTPTPTKARAKAAGLDLNTLFKEYRVVDMDEASKKIPDIKNIIKCADHLDTVFFLGDHRVGRHAEQVLKKVTDQAIEYFSEAGPAGIYSKRLMVERELVEYLI